MKIWLCMPGEESAASKNLIRKIDSLVSKKDLSISHNIAELEQSLRQPLNGYGIAVLIANTIGQLEGYVSLKNTLDYLKIILVLPDFEKDTLARGHKLYPRFISHVNSGFENVAIVLEKMIKCFRLQQLRFKGGEFEWRN